MRTRLGYEAVPRSGKGPAVIVIQEWWGLVPHIQEVCDRLAAEGFLALAPDLYHGKSTKSPDEAGRMMMALNIEQAAQDLGRAVEHLLAHPNASGKKVGVMGFCMGGQLALYAAARFPSQIGACVDFYGIHPNVKADWSSIRCPVLGFFAEKDQFVGPNVAVELESQLKSKGVKTEFKIFPGADHAFFNDSRPEVFDKAAAQQAWKRLLGYFQEQLTASSPA
ncbi:MAG: dienelactone hydrolase family protein [Elusimicrobia bacterium]|nr:dienelactone hydrolase family protein [Elusimicrobiota bacterium]